jgi:polar amino acid transport system substrate-binding protein
MVQIRVNAGRLPPGYWADAAEQGGRIVGEVCHFIDLACYLLDSPVTRVVALGGGGRPPQTQDTLQILMGHGDGSASTIAYVANGSPLVNKERIEAHWDGKSLLIEDFRSWQLAIDGSMKKGRVRTQDKGHASLIASFVAFARGDAANPVPIHQAAHITRVSFAIVESLGTGGWTSLDSSPW